MKKRNKGFLVQDALVCIFIVSTVSSIVFIAISTNAKIQEGIENQCRMQEENMLDYYQNIDVCNICSPETTEEAY